MIYTYSNFQKITLQHWFTHILSLSSLFLSILVLSSFSFDIILSAVTVWLSFSSLCASLVAQTVKIPPAMQETWVQSLGWEDPVERAWLPTPIFWPGEVHGQRSLAGFSPWGCKESDTTERLSLSPCLETAASLGCFLYFAFFHDIWEGWE